tara:strand:+ start:13 stop:669 length:657 start_codon:yes stop_codon:yes gene_type:complete
MENKKGISHAGFAISFVIFVGFLIFIFLIIRPSLNVNTNLDSLSDNIAKQIIEETTEELTKISLQSSECVNIANLLNANSVTNQGTVNLQRISGNFNPNGFSKIYTSTSQILFDQISPVSCRIPQTPTPFGLGLIRTETYIFETKFRNYVTVGNYPDIPAENNFNFELLEYDRETLEEPGPLNEAPSDSSVFVELYPITYLSGDDATIKPGYLKVVVW